MGTHLFDNVLVTDKLSNPNCSYVHARQVTAQAVVTATNTIIELTVFRDTLGEWDAGNYRFLAKNTGWYLVLISGRWGPISSNSYCGYSYPGACDTRQNNVNTRESWTHVTSTIRYLTAGSAVSMYGRQDTGSNNWSQTNSMTFMIIKRIA